MFLIVYKQFVLIDSIIVLLRYVRSYLVCDMFWFFIVDEIVVFLLTNFELSSFVAIGEKSS